MDHGQGRVPPMHPLGRGRGPPAPCGSLPKLPFGLQVSYFTWCSLEVGTDDDPILTEHQFSRLGIECEVNGAFSSPV